MKHINLESHAEPIRTFVLSLAGEPEGSVLELNGRPVARLLPIPAGRNGSAPDDWTPARDDRRCALIDREIDGTLSPAEQTELEDLQGQFLRHRHRVAPLPLAHARQMLEDLERKAAGSTP